MQWKNFKNIFHIKAWKRESGRSAAPSFNPRTGVLDIFPTGSAMNVATVYRCVNVVAGSVAGLPILHQVKKGGVFRTPEHGTLNYLLNVSPNEYESAPDFWSKVVQYILLEGNAYIVPTFSDYDGEIFRLACVNPKCVMHDALSDTYEIHDPYAAIDGAFTENEILHIKNYTTDGKTGVSTISYASLTINTALAGENETFERIQNGGNVRGLVSNDDSRLKGYGKVQDEELKKAATNLDELFRSGKRIVSVPGDAHFSPITLSSQDMQFLDSRKLNGLDICRFFNVPPQLVFYDTASNYKSAEMASVAFLNNGLAPMLRKIEAELERKLVDRRKAGKERIKFDRTELYACDLESKAKYYASLISSGLATVNELRETENKEPVEGGDKVLVSANLKDINDLAGTGKKPNEAPAT